MFSSSTALFFRTGAERSCLYCAVSVLIEKMEIEHEVSVVNTLRQIKARRHSAIPTLVIICICICILPVTYNLYSNSLCISLRPT